MDNRPVAVFDSGLGGITAVREMMSSLPGEDIIYFGDTARVPYGTRSMETIRKYTMQNIRFLRSFDVKAILVACGTMSNVIDDDIKNMTPVPLIGVIEAASARAAATTKNNRIGVIATSATIASGNYERTITRLNPEAKVFSKACPLFVPLVEDGRINRGDVVIETVAKEYLEQIKDADVDTLILGCTHYPLIGDIIADIMGPSVTIINSGREGALALGGIIQPSGKASGGEIRYYVSDSVRNFSKIASMFLGQAVAGHVEKVDIESY